MCVFATVVSRSNGMSVGCWVKNKKIVFGGRWAPLPDLWPLWVQPVHQGVIYLFVCVFVFTWTSTPDWPTCAATLCSCQIFYLCSQFLIFLLCCCIFESWYGDETVVWWLLSLTFDLCDSHKQNVNQRCTILIIETKKTKHWIYCLVKWNLLKWKTDKGALWFFVFFN